MASHTVFQAKTQLNIFLLNRCPRIMRTNLLPSTTKRSLVFSNMGCHLRLGSGWAWIGWWCYWRGRRASRRSSSSPPSGQDMTNNQLLMPLWINKSVASYVLIKLVDTACRNRGIWTGGNWVLVRVNSNSRLNGVWRRKSPTLAELAVQYSYRGRVQATPLHWTSGTQLQIVELEIFLAFSKLCHTQKSSSFEDEIAIFFFNNGGIGEIG